MKSQQEHFLIDLAIREGKFEDCVTAVRLMTAGMAKEPGALRYEWFLSNERSTGMDFRQQ